MNQETVRANVRENYGRIAREGGSCCGPTCCSPDAKAEPAGARPATAERLGYNSQEIQRVPDEANLGLGCGNPHLNAELKAGETVLDLGSGAGFDCFIAARAVGPTGRVIGVDMTPEMISRARRIADGNESTNIEFRLGEIEHLPVATASVDVIISNCVINLSPDKPAAYREAFRVLKPGGRLTIADIVRTGPMPDAVRDNPDMLSGCVSGAEEPDMLRAILTEAGFVDITLTPTNSSADLLRDWFPGKAMEEYVTSAVLRARKPERAAFN